VNEPPQSDAEIIEASFEDPEMFAVVFKRHYRDIHRFVTAVVGYNDGPDLAAEVFVRAFASRQRYRLTYPSAGPWLWGIASNLVGDYYRGRARQLRVSEGIPHHGSGRPIPVRSHWTGWLQRRSDRVSRRR